MEKIECICVMRDLFRSLAELENNLITLHGVTLNEAMVLCSIGKETVTASMVVERTGLAASHTSKVIRAIEQRELITRQLGEKDKRQMYFTLTGDGRKCLESIREQGVEVPEYLRPLFSSHPQECE